MDTGRRPDEILRLRLDCLTRDPDGAAVLVYDNHKPDRRERRLPISQATAAAITAQQQRVRARYPDTPLAELVLLPAPDATPPAPSAQRRPARPAPPRLGRPASRSLRPPTAPSSTRPRSCPTPTGTPTPNATPTPESPSTCCPELLDHRTLDVTRRYYRVGEHRRRAAVDTVTARSFDRHGNRLWRDAHALLDSEHARYAVGDVAVPYGRCTEPSNVASRRRRLPRPVPLRRLRPLPHRRLAPARADRLPRRPAAHPRTARRHPRRDRRVGPRRRHPHRRGDHPHPTADQPHQR